MKENKIQNKNWTYEIVKSIVLPFFRVFYSNIHIENKSRIHSKNPTIIAPNHQNALMDALTVLYATGKRVVFLARADIFKKNAIRKILTFFKILPVFRIRDGRDSLGKNDEIFNKSVDVLHDSVKLCLFAEGKHNYRRQQLPLVKGLIRIAFQAQEDMPEKEVQILPTGIDYGSYSRSQNHLIVDYGDPISVKEYMDLYIQNQPLAINTMRDRLADGMKDVMHNIASDKYYDTFYNLSYIANNSVREKLNIANTVFNRFLVRKKITELLDREEVADNKILSQLDDDCKKYTLGIQQFKLQDWVFESKNFVFSLLTKTLLGILFLPLFLSGFLFHLLPYTGAKYIVTKIKDVQFHSSIKFVVFLLLTALLYIIYFIVAIVIMPVWWMVILFMISLPIVGIFSFKYLVWGKKLLMQWKYYFMLKTKNKKILELKELRNAIIQVVELMFKFD